MSCETPEPAPPTGVLADLCARRCWDDDTDDASRQLLEWAADRLRHENVERVRAINRAEHLEAEVATYVAILYGPQKGGAS